MSVDRITIDTNLLIYAIDVDEGKRHQMAIKVLEKAVHCDCSLSLQVLSEFFYAVTRKNKLSSQIAIHHIQELMELFPVISEKQNTLRMAMNAVNDFKLAFWDALLWATAQDSGMTLLLSENFQHGQVIKNVRIINPFFSNEFWTIQ